MVGLILLGGVRAHGETDSTSAFLDAVNRGDAEAVSILAKTVSLSEPHGERGSLGAYALTTAASLEHLYTVEALLLAGVSPNARWGGRSALGEAAEKGHTDMLYALLDAGADLKSRSGREAGENAAFFGQLKAMELLVGRGLDVNGQASRDSWTPLMAATATGRVEIVHFLLAAGADPHLGVNQRGKKVTAITLAREAKQGEILDLLDRVRFLH